MDELVNEAVIVHHELVGIVTAVSDLVFSRDKKVEIGLSLLRASADHAIASARLIEVTQAELGASVVVLARSQIDSFLRGVFFLQIATDEEVDYFIENDEMPSRKMPNGNMGRLGPKTLASMVEAELGITENGKLFPMVDNTWKSFSGFTHGGMHMVQTYSEADEIGSNIAADNLINLLRNMSVLVTFSACAMVNACGLNVEEQQEVLQKLAAISKCRAERVLEGKA